MIMDATSTDRLTVQVTALFEKYHAEIFGYLARVLNDREAAEDLVQETFLRAFRARQQLAGIENPRAWLYRIATNLALNVIRRRRRLAWLPWIGDTEAQGSGRDMADSVSTRSAVDEALAALSADYQIPLILSIHFGFTIAELAEALGISRDAVKVRLFRAREMFRQAYRRGQAK